MYKLKLKKVIHYAESDPECISDYYSIDLMRDGKIIEHFGDWYHDKGDAKCEGFIKGVEYLLGGTESNIELEVEEERVADGKV